MTELNLKMVKIFWHQHEHAQHTHNACHADDGQLNKQATNSLDIQHLESTARQSITTAELLILFNLLQHRIFAIFNITRGIQLTKERNML